jgi:protein-tyrosine phosphatase
MFTKIYWLHRFENNAQLAIMARPRGGEWLEEEIAMLKKQHVHALVSLLESHEIAELGLSKEQQLCEAHGITFINFPIPDRSVPEKYSRLEPFLTMLMQQIQEGHSVVIHCRMGIGRSSIIAGCLLLEAGLKTDFIFQHITKVRGLKVPDTEEQVRWLKEREKNKRTN